MRTFYDSLSKIAKRSGILQEKAKTAREWFAEQVKNAGARVTDVMRSNLANSMPYPHGGDVCLFGYNAQLKDKLPYWDRLPVVIVLERYRDGFLGLNLHYVPPLQRAMLFDLIVADFFAEGDARLTGINYHRVKMAKFKWAQPAVKRYKYRNIKTQIKKIEADSWEYIIHLPIEDFTGRDYKSLYKVWADSVKIVGASKW